MKAQKYKNPSFKIKSLLTLSLFLFFSNAEARVFGNDDRSEIYLHPTIQQKVSPSVGIMLSPVFLNKKTDGYEANFNLNSDSYELALCKGERFYGQPTASVSCTGFLVAPDLIMTAGHCITRVNSEVRNEVTPQCRDFMWVFDYKYKNRSSIDLFFPNENVAYCKEVIYAKFDHIKLNNNMPKPIYGDDIALIKLDRKIQRPILNFSTEVKRNERVYTVGHPDGLPQKLTNNGIVKSASEDNYFTSTLDVFGGNSGGPVLNYKNEVLGVVVRSVPYDDYKYLPEKQCSVVRRCSQSLSGCLLSDQQKIEDLYSHAQKVSEELKMLIKNSN